MVAVNDLVATFQSLHHSFELRWKPKIKMKEESQQIVTSSSDATTVAPQASCGSVSKRK